MNDPPIPSYAGTDHAVPRMETDEMQPPSPAQFVTLPTLLEDDVNFETYRSRKAKRSKLSEPDINQDESLQVGQTTPPNSFASVPIDPIILNSQSVGSTQPTQTPRTPNTQVARQLYGSLDKGPYTVHVQRIEATQTSGTTIHPVTFGKFLYSRSNEFTGLIDGSVKSNGRNCIALDFFTDNCANKFLQSPALGANNYRAFIPTFNVTRMGIVRGIPTDMSDEEVLSNIKVPKDCGSILKMRRLNFKVTIEGVPTWKPTQTVVFTFDGQVLPSRIFLCYCSFPVDLYTYPTIQCFNCCRFGHTKTQCRSKPRCFKCAQDHTADSCNVEETQPKCILCEGKHFAISKACPELQRQKNIKKMMSEKCISYSECSKLFAPSKKSFADITSSAPPAPLSSLPPQPPQPTFTSYKKSVPRRPRSPPPRRSGYDREAHNNLTREDYSESAPNGCALNNNFSDIFSNTQLITEIIKLLNLISSFFNNSASSSPNQPNHVASMISNLLSLLSNGSNRQDPAMEYS